MSTSRVDWRTVGLEEFNRLVEALLVRDRTVGPLVGQAIDGRGGDDGIDVDVRVARTRQLVEILQLKYFPEGFSGKFSDRRRQIRDSFETALKEEPPVWTLVVPRNLTVQERKSVWSMRKGRKVLIRFVGQAELDGLIAKYPDVQASAARDPARDALELVGREAAALARPDDLAAEVHRLQRRVAGRSPYWAVDFSTHGDVYTETVRALRPDAAEREPLRIRFGTSFANEDQPLREAFERKLRYGSVEELTLPGRVINSFVREGPEWFSGSVDIAQLRIGVANQIPVGTPLKTKLYTKDGRRLIGLSGAVIASDVGAEGATVQSRLEGGILCEWRLLRDVERGGSVALHLSPAGANAHELARGIRFLDAAAEAVELRLSVGSVGPSPLLLGEHAPFEVPIEMRELVDDLVYLERELDLSIRFPSEAPDNSDRVWARVLVRLLHGQAVRPANIDGINGIVEIPDESELGPILAEPHMILATADDWGINLFGCDLIVGTVTIFAAHAEIEDAADLLAALRDGSAQGRPFKVRATKAPGFVAYMPDRFNAAQPVTPTPWSLQGIREPTFT